jgi:hypothetical protein
MAERLNFRLTSGRVAQILVCITRLLLNLKWCSPPDGILPIDASVVFEPNTRIWTLE